MPPPHRPRAAPRAWLASLFALLTTVGLALAATPGSAAGSAALPRAPLDEAGYWSLADTMQQRLDRFWSEGSSAYRIGGGGADPAANGQLLVTHAVAAQRDHAGPSRNDRRARVIARRLVEGPPFVDALTGRGSHRHAPGWVNSLDSPRGEQHLVFDAQVVEGLEAAWRARRELALPGTTVRLIEDRIHRTAHGRYWRYPALKLNQVNWYGLMYTAAATVAGDRHLLRRDFALQLRRFVRGIGHRGRAAGNLGPGGRFHYLPGEPVGHPMNVDSAEYANIVMSLTQYLDQARGAGMRLPHRVRSALRAWAIRVLAGYWTHAGYMNWDTGLGFERWHQAKKLGLTQEALIGLASDRTLGLSSRRRGWAKYMLDRGLLFYERWARIEGGIPAPVFFGVHAVPQPPALFAYDPDIGRLAVTTPHYNTAVIAVNQRAFPYGGIELARLFDRDQDVAGPVAGRPPAAFGLVVRGRRGNRVLATQLGRSRLGHGASLRVIRGGASRAGSTPGGRIQAGPFRSLKATGTVSASGLLARTTHAFTARNIVTTWMLQRRHSGRSLDAEVLFPSHGPRGAIEAKLRNGRRVRLGRGPLSLSRVRAFGVRSYDSGYRVRVRSAPRNAVARALPMHEQPSAPHPGPSLSIRVARGSNWHGARLAAQLTVQPNLGLRDAERRLAR